MTVFVIKHSHFSLYTDFSKRTVGDTDPYGIKYRFALFYAYTLSLIHWAIDIDLSHSSAPND